MPCRESPATFNVRVGWDARRRLLRRVPARARRVNPPVQQPVAWRTRLRGAARQLGTDRGAAVAEWTLVAALLTLLLLAVLQVSFAMHVRTTLVDAAAEGARAAGLSGASNTDGRIRTSELIHTALSDQYADHIEVTRTDHIVTVTVRSPLPLLGLVGIPNGIEVSAHAPVE